MKSQLVWVAVALACFFSLAIVSVSAQDGGTDRMVALKQRLATVGQQVKNLEEDAEKVQQEYLDLQYKAAYSNEQTMAVYQEIKQLEKKLVEKRKELGDVLEKSPEFRDMEKRRSTVFNRLSKLREEARLTKQEIEALEARTGGKKE